MLSLSGVVVTADAMACQREIARTITDQGGAYVLALKGNQGTLLEDVKLVLNGLITNDKFCLTRAGKLQLSWPRARHRLRRTVAPQLPGEVTHQGGQHAGSAAPRLARPAHRRADAHGPAALGPGVSAPPAVGDDLPGADRGLGGSNPAGGLSCG
jgi:hypothetical protein